MESGRILSARVFVLVVAGWTGIGGVSATAQEPARGMVAEVRRSRRDVWGGRN